MTTASGRLRIAPQDSAWANRVRHSFARCARPVAFVAPPELGVEFAIAGMNSAQRRLIWVEFDHRDHGDLMSQGAKLTDSVERALGVATLEYGLTLPQVLAELARMHPLLGPFTVCLSGLRDVNQVRVALSSLATMGSYVLLHWKAQEGRSDLGLGSSMIEVDESEFFVDDAELAELIDPGPPASPEGAIGSAGRRALLDLFRLYLDPKELDLVLVPRPGGADFLVANRCPALDVGRLAGALAYRGRAIDAFELLVHHGLAVPQEVMNAAGRDYLDRGLHRRLWAITSDIPAPVRHQSEAMMRWSFAAATVLNKHKELRAEVGKYLETREAPELRALFAAAFPGPEFLREAVRAHEAEETPTTLRIRAFAENLDGQGAASALLLQRALQLSEQLGDNEMVVASATDLADYWSRVGAYREAIIWSSWALDWYWRTGCRDELRRLVAASMLSFNRLLVGDAPGSGILDDETWSLTVAGIPTSEAVLSSAAEVAFVAGDLAKAERLLRAIMDKVQLEQFSGAAVDLVHVLMQLGREHEAIELGRRALAISRSMNTRASVLGRLAFGLSHVGIDPALARSHLDAVVEVLASSSEAPRLAQASIALAISQLRSQDPDGANRTLERGERGLCQLGGTGWTLLGGFAPEVRTLRSIYGQDVCEVEMSYLGSTETRVGGRRVQLGLRQCEVLTVLALNDAGLSADGLGVRVYGDGAQRATIKAIVSRLRDRVPIANRPYRIGVEYWADFLHVATLTRTGRYREAVAMYRGPLLPGSDAPAITEMREHLEEMLRAAVLQSGDVEAMLMLADVLVDDLGLLEAALDRLSPVDIRAPIVRARRNSIMRDWGGGFEPLGG
jgi:tetratricopeptide (TPR) repeat protein